jgi:hypothetical protein
MKLVAVALILVSSVGLSATTAADGPHPVRPLPGYKCMMLNLTEQQFLNPSVHVPVRSEPAASAPEVGWAATNAAVRTLPISSMGSRRLSSRTVRRFGSKAGCCVRTIAWGIRRPNVYRP